MGLESTAMRQARIELAGFFYGGGQVRFTASFLSSNGNAKGVRPVIVVFFYFILALGCAPK